jgi:co-chaperonin GroES (HSP10)
MNHVCIVDANRMDVYVIWLPTFQTTQLMSWIQTTSVGTTMRRTKMKLVGKKILVTPMRTKSETRGGIALPDQSVQTLPIGPIVAMGPDVVDHDLHVGGVVMFSSIGAMPVVVNDKAFILIEPEDILMILEKGEYDGSE